MSFFFLVFFCVSSSATPNLDEELRRASAVLDERRDAESFASVRATLRARDAALAALDDDARHVRTGFTPEGLRALALEGWVLRAQVTAWPRARASSVVVDVAAASALALALVEAFLWLAGAWFVVRRGPAVTRLARAGVALALPASLSRVVAPIVAVALRALVEAAPIIAVELVFSRALAGAASELTLWHAPLLCVAIARFAFVAARGMASTTLLAGPAGLAPDTRAAWSRFCSSVSVAVCVCFCGSYFVSVCCGSSGALHALVARSSVVVVVVVVLVGLRGLAPAIARLVMTRRPTSGLAARLQGARPAFAHVLLGAGVASGIVVADALREVLGQSGSARRLLAWAFRRRLQSVARASAPPLSPQARAVVVARVAHAERPQEEQQKLSALRDRVVSLARDHTGFSAAVVGAPGTGRSAALVELIDEKGALPLCRGRPTKRLSTEREACAFLSKLVGAGGDAEDDVDVVKRLRALPPRLIVIDDAQRFLLRAQGGLEGYKALVDVVGRTSDRHGWLLAFHEPAYSFAAAVYGARNELQQVVRLRPWSADEVSALLAARLRKAGLAPRFDDLVDDDAAAVDLVRTGESFFHLVWDSADGNPRHALHLLADSLVDEQDGVVRVRAFHSHEAHDLEDAESFTRLVLAALAMHHTATVDDIARVLREPAHVCESALMFLAARGVVILDREGASVAPAWQIAVTRFLQQKNLALR